MKKPLLSVMALCVAFSLISCGNEKDKPLTEKDPDTWTEADLENALQQAIDAADKSSGTASQETPAPAVSSFDAKQEILNASWESGLIQIDDKLVQLPLTLSDWLALGLDYEVDSGKKSKDYLFTQNEQVSMKLTYNGAQLGSLIFIKETATPETMEAMNPMIEELSILPLFGWPENITIYLPGGMTFGDPYTSIEEKLGSGAEIDANLTYTYGRMKHSQSDILYGIQIIVNKNTQSICGFDIGKSLQADDRKNLTTLSFDNMPNTQTSDTHNVTLLWPSEYKLLSGGLTLQTARRVDSVLNDNGKKYYMSISFSMLAQKYASPYEYLSYGDPVLDVTDENGMNRKVYKADGAYLVNCSTDVHIFKATIKLEDLSDPSADALAALQDLVIEIANSVQFNS